MHRALIGKGILLAAALLASTVFAGCGGKKNNLPQGTGTSAEPDKVLYERAMDDIKHDRLQVARLELQTLLNTYPDSEYQAKAKLAIADSYYKEGGPTSLSQSVAEYQDFITFFPFLDEAAYAQSQVGMAHFRQMEKPDRDHAEALEAEGAFQTYLLKFPDNPQRPQVEQRLREVQEVLAEGDYAIADFYYIRGSNRAAVARLLELADRYPLYSQADRVNWMIASIYERSEHADIAAQYYTRIVKDYPLSKLAADSKAKLVKSGFPVPQPDPTALARMQTEQSTPRQRGNVLSAPLGMLKTGPNLSLAARTGSPTLAPENDQPVLPLSPAGGTSRVGGSPGSVSGGGTGGAYIETVTPGTSGPAGDASSQPATASQPDAAAPADQPAGSTDQPAASASGDASQTPAATPDSSANNPKTESSSKKKKGLHKIIPF